MLAIVNTSRSLIKTSLQNLSIANAALRLASSATQATTTSSAIPKQKQSFMIRSLRAASSRSLLMPATSSSSSRAQLEAAARSKAESASKSSEASSATKMVPSKRKPSQQPNATCPNAQRHAKSVSSRTAAIAALFPSSNSMLSTMVPTRDLTALRTSPMSAWPLTCSPRTPGILCPSSIQPTSKALRQLKASCPLVLSVCTRMFWTWWTSRMFSK